MFKKHVQDPRRYRNMILREKIEASTRAFFKKQGFLETRTPIVVPCPGMEPHIRPFQVNSVDPKEQKSAYLQTSPEFAMKKLLVGGLEKIFQICPVYRNEPCSPHHHPEFTMLEWYRANSSYEKIMEDVENLVSTAAIEIHHSALTNFNGTKINLAPPWPRLKIRDLYQDWLDIDLAHATERDLHQVCVDRKIATASANTPSHDTWDDLFFKLWLNEIEPKLPQDQAVFIVDYPPSQAALAEVGTAPDGTKWAKRFEAFAGGLELGNAFQELCDPIEQRKRFIKDMDLRKDTYGDEFPPNPIDEGFLKALEEGLPPSAGIAVGVDRLVMLLTGETDIQYTFWLPSGAVF